MAATAPKMRAMGLLMLEAAPVGAVAPVADEVLEPVEEAPLVAEE